MFLDGQRKRTVTLSGAKGLNTSLSSTDISKNELSTAYNVWFDAGSGKLVTRGGIVAKPNNALSSPITMLKSFVRKHDEAWVVCVSDSKLYYDNQGVWVYLFDIESEYPKMESFNGRLYVADGCVDGILYWDGTTIERLAGSPQATSIFVANNSLIANSLTELDAVYVSAIETDDFSVDKGGVIVRAGYGDGQNVNGFAAISKLLIVSKTSSVNGKVSKKTFYSINMTGSSSGWSADYVSHNNAAIGPHAIHAVAQDVLYIDTKGIEALSPTQKYGDISEDPIVGGKINKSVMHSLKVNKTEPKIKYIPNLAATFFLISDEIYVLSSLTGAFTELDFNTKINDIEQHGDDVFLAGESGHLYRFSNAGVDEIVTGHKSPFSSVIGFKMISGNGDLLLSNTHIELGYITPGSYNIMASNGRSSERTVLQHVQFSISAGDEMLHDANYELNNADFDLDSVGTQKRIPCRAKYRGDGIALQVSCSDGGRLSFGRVSANVAQIGK